MIHIRWHCLLENIVDDSVFGYTRNAVDCSRRSATLAAPTALLYGLRLRGPFRQDLKQHGSEPAVVLAALGLLRRLPGLPSSPALNLAVQRLEMPGLQPTGRWFSKNYPRLLKTFINECFRPHVKQKQQQNDENDTQKSWYQQWREQQLWNTQSTKRKPKETRNHKQTRDKQTQAIRQETTNNIQQQSTAKHQTSPATQSFQIMTTNTSDNKSSSNKTFLNHHLRHQELLTHWLIIVPLLSTIKHL